MENWVFHELDAHRHYSKLHYDLGYWRLASGQGVDFILGDMKIAIESKATSRITSDHLKGLREVARDHPKIRSRLVVCLEDRQRRTEDGIDILPAARFTELLWEGMIIPE